MKMFRNPGVIKDTVLFTVTAAAFIIAAFILNPVFAVFAAAASLSFGLIGFISHRRQMRRLSALSDEVGSILHTGAGLLLDDSCEGEIAILRSDIHKLSVKLSAQTEELKREKGILADSMANISHQLRTPLTTLNLISTLLADESASPERRTELVRELKVMLSRLDWLISSLLMISKIDAGTVTFDNKTVMVSELVEKACEPLLIPMELREQTLSVQMQGQEQFSGDLPWSVEAIGNILKNAMEHTRVGGRISVTCRENAVFTEIVIEDNGEGIAPEDLPRLFDRFYKGKRSSKDSIGIGLALARTIIASQNGTVTALSPQGQGARFTVRFYKSTV